MTTDKQDEVFDIVDVNDNVIGKSTRGEVHSNKNLIHRSVGVAIFNSNNKIFLQRRSVTKDVDALLWTISCSGHVTTGDSYESTAVREMKEELGISGVNPIFLTKYIYQGTMETEMASLYKALYNGEIFLQEDEILEGRFFSQDELIAAVSTKEIELNNYGKLSLSKLGFINNS